MVKKETPRQNGYYWVKASDSGEWEVAYWDARERTWDFYETACDTKKPVEILARIDPPTIVPLQREANCYKRFGSPLTPEEVERIMTADFGRGLETNSETEVEEVEPDVHQPRPD